MTFGLLKEVSISYVHYTRLFLAQMYPVLSDFGNLYRAVHIFCSFLLCSSCFSLPPEMSHLPKKYTNCSRPWPIVNLEKFNNLLLKHQIETTGYLNQVFIVRKGSVLMSGLFLNWESRACLACGMYPKHTFTICTDSSAVGSKTWPAIALLDPYIWATSWENLFMPYANNKGADQHLCFCCLDSKISLVSVSEISSL